MVRDWRQDAAIRRLGERRTLPEQLPAFVVRSRSGLFRRGPERIPAHVHDVSVTGIGFFAATSQPMQVSDLVQFEIAGTSTNVRIRRVVDESGSGWTYYGAQFVDPQQTVLLSIDQAMNGDVLERAERWHSPNLR